MSDNAPTHHKATREQRAAIYSLIANGPNLYNLGKLVTAECLPPFVRGIIAREYAKRSQPLGVARALAKLNGTSVAHELNRVWKVEGDE